MVSPYKSALSGRTTKLQELLVEVPQPLRGPHSPDREKGRGCWVQREVRTKMANNARNSKRGANVEPPLEDSDVLPKRQRSSLSKVKTQDDFAGQCRGYSIQSGYAVPEVLNSTDLEEILRACAPGLVSCKASVRIDNEASLYPFVYELLKPLVELTEGKHIRAEKKSQQVLSANEIEEVAETFIRLSREAREPDDDDTEVALLMRWERYFKEHFGSGQGYVEFSIEGRDEIVRLLAECKKTLVRQLPPQLDSIDGYWQAAAEGVAAQRENVRVKGERAYKSTYNSIMEAEDSKIAEERASTAPGKSSKGTVKSKQLSLEAAADTAARAARAKAEASAFEDPVYVTLTDFREWIFFKIVGKIIVVSEPVTMFEFKLDGTLTSQPNMVNGLRYLCAAVGLGQYEPGKVAGILGHIRGSHDKAVSALVDSVFGLEYDPLLKEACTGAWLLKEVGTSDSRIEELLRKKNPKVDMQRVWEVLRKNEENAARNNN